MEREANIELTSKNKTKQNPTKKQNRGKSKERKGKNQANFKN